MFLVPFIHLLSPPTHLRLFSDLSHMPEMQSNPRLYGCQYVRQRKDLAFMKLLWPSLKMSFPFKGLESVMVRVGMATCELCARNARLVHNYYLKRTQKSLIAGKESNGEFRRQSCWGVSLRC